MRLKNPNEEPIGGWRYWYEDSFKNRYFVAGDSRKTLFKNVRSDMKANGIAIPENLEAIIEDQICMKQPKGRCLYDQGLGDTIAKNVHVFAGGIDATMAKMGVKTQLEKRARECSGCAKRRMQLNG